jgi:hypothetical protein
VTQVRHFQIGDLSVSRSTGYVGSPPVPRGIGLLIRRPAIQPPQPATVGSTVVLVREVSTGHALAWLSPWQRSDRSQFLTALRGLRSPRLWRATRYTRLSENSYAHGACDSGSITVYRTESARRWTLSVQAVSSPPIAPSTGRGFRGRRTGDTNR